MAWICRRRIEKGQFLPAWRRSRTKLPDSGETHRENESWWKKARVHSEGSSGNTRSRVRISKVKEGKSADLLLVSKERKKHFCVIKSLARLLSSQIDSHEHQKFISRRCLNHFSSSEKLGKHSELCSLRDFVKLEMKEGVVRFRNWNRSMKVPFVIYVGFEALNVLCDEVKGGTRQYQKHKARGFCFQVVCGFDETFLLNPSFIAQRARRKTSRKCSWK